MSWIFVIPGIAVGLSLLAIAIEVLMHDREKGKEIEFAIIRKRREIKQYQKSNDTKAMMKANKELMSLMGSNFKLRMRTMLISFPMFIIIFFFLHNALGVGPLYAGEVSQVGADVRNLAMSPQTVSVELVSDGIDVTGTNARELELDDKGDQGDREQVWWNVTASEGEKTYEIRVKKGNDTGSESYTVKFVPQGNLFAEFSSPEPSQLLGETVELNPLYKGVEIQVLGINLSWFWYYFITYFIISLAMMPLKNRVLWGHWGGVKHLEKIEREKNETTEE